MIKSLNSTMVISISMKWSWTLPCLSPWVDGESRCSSLHSIKYCARVFSEKEGSWRQNRVWPLSLLPEEDRPPEANPGLLTNGQSSQRRLIISSQSTGEQAGVFSEGVHAGPENQPAGEKS